MFGLGVSCFRFRVGFVGGSFFLTPVSESGCPETTAFSPWCVDL